MSCPANAPEILFGNILTGYEPVHERLELRIAELDDDVVRHIGKSLVAHQRHPNGVALQAAVQLPERNDGMLAECLDDGADRFHWSSRGR